MFYALIVAATFTGGIVFAVLGLAIAFALKIMLLMFVATAACGLLLWNLLQIRK